MHLRILFALLFCWVLLGCASNLLDHSVQARLLPNRTQGTEIRSALEVKFALDSGYERRILANSKWRKLGEISQGSVYKREGDAFTIEGSHVHEAYLVVSNGKLIGFFLPFENVFVPQRDAPLIFGE
jgi:hypothetical protein